MVTLTSRRPLKAQPVENTAPRSAVVARKQATATKEEDFVEEPVHREHARLHPVLLETVAGSYWLKDLRGAGRRPQQPRQADREPVPAAGSREDHRDRGPTFEPDKVHLHGNQYGYREEDVAGGLQSGRRPASSRLTLDDGDYLIGAALTDSKT